MLGNEYGKHLPSFTTLFPFGAAAMTMVNDQTCGIFNNVSLNVLVFNVVSRNGKTIDEYQYLQV